MDTSKSVKEVVAEVLETSADAIEADHLFVEDLGATSIDIVNLVWRIEEVYGLGELGDEELKPVQTVGDLQRLVAHRLGADGEDAVAQGVDIALASDHAGVELKDDLVHWLQQRGEVVRDLGPADTTSVDYPDFAARVASAVASGRAHRGILICGSGIGMSIAANKVAGIRAVVANNSLQAELSRRHNDANILCLGQRLTGPDLARDCVRSFLATSFDPGDDGRHQRRVNRIASIGADQLADR